MQVSQLQDGPDLLVRVVIERILENILTLLMSTFQTKSYIM